MFWLVRQNRMTVFGDMVLKDVMKVSCSHKDGILFRMSREEEKTETHRASSRASIERIIWDYGEKAIICKEKSTRENKSVDF